MSFEHCYFCLPPVRYPGCQDHCPYYADIERGGRYGAVSTYLYLAQALNVPIEALLGGE